MILRVGQSWSCCPCPISPFRDDRERNRTLGATNTSRALSWRLVPASQGLELVMQRGTHATFHVGCPSEADVSVDETCRVKRD